MIRQPPRSTRTDTLFPTRRSSDLISVQRSASHTFHAPRRRLDTPDNRERHASGVPAKLPPAGPLERRFRLGSGLERWRSTRRRSEEHTSELQSLMRISYAVFCLKKKQYPLSL